MAEGQPQRRVPRLLDAETREVHVSCVIPDWVCNDEPIRAVFWKRDASGHGIPAEDGGLDDVRHILESQTVRQDRRTVIFCGYENRWGKSGGIASVSIMLPTELRDAGERVIRISPFHRRLGSPPLEHLATCNVRFEQQVHQVKVYSAVYTTDQNPDFREDWILFEAEEFFNAEGGAQQSDPYVYSGETKAQRDGDESKLLRDSLFAAAAIPQVIAALARTPEYTELESTQNLIFHAQDWELACLALTVKEWLMEVPDRQARSALVLLTLHNPFDHGLSLENLKEISPRSMIDQWPAVEGDARTTVLTCMIPLTDGPVSVVSRVFAQELTQHPLQTGHFAGHYQGILRRQRIVGIDNGLFDKMGLSEEELDAAGQARAGRVETAVTCKDKRRLALLTALPRYLDQIRRESESAANDLGTQRTVYGDIDLSRDDVPIFMMTGRLDPGQKGFDLFARAIEQTEQGRGRYIISPLSPMPDDAEIGQYLDDLIQLARSREEEVLLLPFRLDRDIYPILRAAASWSVWPSMYEPFGGATEFYLSGTPVIARATGGLRQQVIAYTGPGSAEQASGILFEESLSSELFDQLRQQCWLSNPAGSGGDPTEDELLRWEHRRIQTALAPKRTSAEQTASSGTGMLLPARTDSVLYQAMVDALAQAINLAADLYRSRYQAQDYGRILGNLPEMAELLSWERSVDEYRKWYDRASRA